MRALAIGAMILLAGCATGPTGAWVNDGDGGFCYKEGSTCTASGPDRRAGEDRQQSLWSRLPCGPSDESKWCKVLGAMNDAWTSAEPGFDAMSKIRR